MRLLCKATLVNSTLEVAKDTNDGSLWLLNDEVSNAEVTARELFGFNVGQFSEVTAGPVSDSGSFSSYTCLQQFMQTYNLMNLSWGLPSNREFMN